LPLLHLGKVELRTDVVAWAVVHTVLVKPYLPRPREPGLRHTVSMRRD